MLEKMVDRLAWHRVANKPSISLKLNTAKCNRKWALPVNLTVSHQTKEGTEVARNSRKRQIKAGIHNTSCVIMGSDRPFLSLQFPHLSDRINPHRVACQECVWDEASQVPGTVPGAWQVEVWSLLPRGSGFCSGAHSVSTLNGEPLEGSMCAKILGRALGFTEHLMDEAEEGDLHHRCHSHLHTTLVIVLFGVKSCQTLLQPHGL